MIGSAIVKPVQCKVHAGCGIGVHVLFTQQKIVEIRVYLSQLDIEQTPRQRVNPLSNSPSLIQIPHPSSLASMLGQVNQSVVGTPGTGSSS